MCVNEVNLVYEENLNTPLAAQPYECLLLASYD